MAKIYYDNSADLALIRAKKVAILGYGSQGHAHALNLRDSGVSVQVGLPDSSRSRAKAEQHQFKVSTPDRACAWADVIMVVTPDTGQPALYASAIAPHLARGKTLMFAHGFNIHFKTIQPPADVDVTMVAPKAPGHRVREVFTEGGGTPCAARHSPGRQRPGQGAHPRLCQGARLHPRRRARNHLQGRDRNRPLRRADGALRRRQRARQGRI